jgi:hypothetical protein
MDNPTPRDTQQRPLPSTLEESAKALADLRRQMQALNARLEYLRVMLKLGVR